MGEQVYVVGKDTPEGFYEIQGIYTDKQVAINNSRIGWWIGAIPLNVPLPDETIEWDVEHVV